MASSLLVLELYWFFSMSICPRASEIVFPSTSSNPFSSEDIASRQTSCTSLANLVLSTRFVSQAFKIMSPLVCLDRDSRGTYDTLYFCTSKIAS
jgi:hypothetical protein